MRKYLLLILLLLFIATPSYAANLVYVERESAITFKDSGGTEDITLNDLDDNVARISDQHDLGGTTNAEYYTVRGVFEFDSAPTAGETVDIYISTSDGTDPDGQEGVVDADLGSQESLKNMMFVGSVVANTATADHQFTATFITRIATRYFSIVVDNSSAADHLQATANTCWVVVTPIPPEVQ